MWRRIWSVLLAAAMVLSLTGTALAADPAAENKDANFEYEPIESTDADGNKIVTYRVIKYIGKDPNATIPDRFNNKPVTAIGKESGGENDKVFDNGEITGKVIIPNSIEQIGQYAFAGANLTDVEIPGSVKKIGDHAFDTCTALTNVVLLDYANKEGKILPNHTVIGEYAFADCISIVSLTIPNSVTQIGKGAFSGCSALEELVFPFSVTTINDETFKDCGNLKNVVLLGSKVTFNDTPFEWEEIFKNGYFHCAYNMTKQKVIEQAKKIAPGPVTLNKYLSRIHDIEADKTAETSGLYASSHTPNQCKAYGTNGKVLMSFKCTYEYVKTPAEINPDTKEEITPAVTGYCERYGNDKGNVKQTLDRDVSAVYHHELPITEKIEATCAEEGLAGGTRCDICNQIIEPQEITPATGKHSYTDSTESDRRELFSVLCNSKDSGLTLVTKKCSVCHYIPVCYLCEELELALDEASAGLEAAQKELEDAIAKAEQAKKEAEAADAANEAAQKALDEANTKATEAEDELDKATEKVTDAKAKYDAAAEADKEAAKKALDEAEAEAKAAQTAKTAADRNAAEKQIARDEADTAAKNAQDALDAANTAKKEAAGKIENDTKLSTAQKNIRDHLTAASIQHLECAVCSELIEKIAEADNADKQAAKDALSAHQSESSHSPTDISAAISFEEITIPEHQWGDSEVPDGDEIPECGSGGFVVVQSVHTCKICGTTEPTGKTEIIDAAEKHTRPDNVKIKERTEATCSREGEIIYEDFNCPICKRTVSDWKETIPKTEHTRPEGIEEITIPATCTEVGKVGIPEWKCAVCGETVPESMETISALGHDYEPLGKDEIIQKATCTTPGKKKTGGERCTRCGDIRGGEEKEIPALGHNYVKVEDEDEIIQEATCTTPGKKKTGKEQCTICNDIKEGEEVEIPALGHDWGEFVPDEGQDAEQAEDCHEKTVTGTVSCKRGCNVAPEKRTITIPGKMDHTWGEWTVTKQPTATEEGERTRTCKVCGVTQTEAVPAAPPTPAEPDDPDNPDNPDNPDQPSNPEDDTYTINIVQASNGIVTASKSTAKKGDLVTFTASPSSGYEIDMIRVIGGGVTAVTYTNLGGGQYRFTMPAANVEIRVSFSRRASDSPYYWSDSIDGSSSSGSTRRTTDIIPTQNPSLSVPRAGASGQLFFDIPYTHWASGEISWAYQMGYMNGFNGRFNPDGTISYQQLWMVLARLTGTYPTNMEEARRWAVEHAFADGSSPTGAVPRHHVITALYRCAHLMGTSNRNTTSLAGYVDSRLVPASGRDAMAWAIANGIVTGDSSKRLNPTATVTRAQFAVILYRFSQRA